jgi:hypothetical protein
MQHRLAGHSSRPRAGQPCLALGNDSGADLLVDPDVPRPAGVDLLAPQPVMVGHLTDPKQSLGLLHDDHERIIAGGA